MGSFNVTCSVSRLPITASTAIRAFVVAIPKHAPEHIFSSTSLCVPITTALSGTYDDYGCIENCKSLKNFNIGAGYFLPHLKGYHKSLLDSGTTENLSLPHLGNCQTRLAFIREDVYQEVMKAGNTPSTDKDIISDLQLLKKALEQTPARLPERFKASAALIEDTHLTLLIPTVSKKTPLLGTLYQYEGDLLYSAMRPYRDKLIEMADKKPADDKETVEFAKTILEHLQFDRGLQRLAILWQPTTNIIGQETPYDLQAAFNKAIHGICVKEIKAQEKAERAYQKTAAKKTQGKPK